MWVIFRGYFGFPPAFSGWVSMQPTSSSPADPLLALRLARGDLGGGVLLPGSGAGSRARADLRVSVSVSVSVSVCACVRVCVCVCVCEAEE